MLNANEIDNCVDAGELTRTLHSARTLHKAALAIGSPANVGPSDQWRFPAEKWEALEARANKRLQDFMPQAAKAVLPVPTALLLSRVFGLGRHAREKARQFSFRYGNAEVTYTGPELRQFDARALFALYELTKRVALGEPVAFRPSEVLRVMNTEPTGYYYVELEAAIRRLQMSLISVKYCEGDRRSGFEVQLLGKREWNASDPDGVSWIHIDSSVRRLFGAGYTPIPLQLRMSLPDGLVSWLATMLFAVRRKSENLQFPLTWLKEACGSRAAPHEFKKKLRRACERLHQEGVLAGYTVKRVKGGVDVVSVTMA